MRTKFSHSTQDEYYTPLYAVEIIVPYLKKKSIIWCPFDTKKSNYVKKFIELGHTVHYTHINNGEDFLTYIPDFNFDCIITNPAFSIKNETILKCLTYNKPFALLLPMTMLNSIETINIFNKFDVQFIIMDKRVSFNGNRPNFTCWYVCNNFLPKNIMIHLFNQDPRDLYKNEKGAN